MTSPSLEALPKRHTPNHRVWAVSESSSRPTHPHTGDQREAPVPAPSHLPRNLAELTVLVVDDDSASLEFFAVVLKICGAAVVTASSAREALGLVQERRPDVILSDISMVGQDGYWLVREIGALSDQAARAIPVVATTAYGREHSRDRALAGGFRDFLAKPVEPSLLCLTIARAAGH